MTLSPCPILAVLSSCWVSFLQVQAWLHNSTEKQHGHKLLPICLLLVAGLDTATLVVADKNNGILAPAPPSSTLQHNGTAIATAGIPLT